MRTINKANIKFSKYKHYNSSYVSLAKATDTRAANTASNISVRSFDNVDGVE